MAGEARLVGEWSYALMTLRSRGKGNGRLSRQASWQMLELEMRLKGEGVLCYMKNARLQASPLCRTLIYPGTNLVS